MAAVTGGQVRLEQRLKVKLGEAKNLLPRSHGSIGVRDVYCVLSLDQEEIFRSATIEKTLDPFFGEEFQFDIPREFRYLSVYVYDRDRHMKTDKIIGKVSIKREELTKHNGKDQWLAVTHVDADSEVQGKVHVRIQLKSLRHMNDTAPQPMVEVKIEECSDLCIVNGSCDPYAVVTMHYTNKKQENKRTKTKKKTVTPHFDETFFFEQSPSYRQTQHNTSAGPEGSSTYSVNHNSRGGGEESGCSIGGFQCLQVAMWHESSGMFGNVFLGELRIPLQGLAPGRDMNAWYLLQPRESSVRNSQNSSNINSSKGGGFGLGSLRLNLHYSCTHVFPSSLYDTLRSLLLHTATTQPVSASVGWLVGEVCGGNKQEAAVPLTRVLLQHNMAVPFIARLAAHEMKLVTDPNTIFRGNTLVSKCMDELMKLAGHHYLKETLKPAIDQVCREKKPCEVDPARIPSTENRETNLANLCEYTNTILRTINNSALSCPPVMCQIFSELREHANALFPNQREVRYSVISGFIFLRFFAPAILGPKLFDITSQQIDLSTVRVLTLISKTVQGVGNLVSSRNLQHTCKEEYMRDVFALCTNNKLVDAARTFLEIISSMPNGNLKAYDTPVVLREGIMIKRAQGRKKFGLKNFKTRYFRLNTRSLTYAKSKGSVPLCIIPVEDILAVEAVQESSFKCKNMFQLVQRNRTLYIQASNCVEEKEWLDLLTKVCKYNKHRLKEYHPGAYLNSHWQCCRATSENAPGCSAVSNYLEVDLNIQIDAEREMECILGILLANVDKLRALHDMCSDSEGSSTRLVTERLLEAVHTLHTHHRAHLATLRRKTRPGSKQAPIGDDNYLLLSSHIGQHDNIVWDTGQLCSGTPYHDNNAKNGTTGHHSVSVSGGMGTVPAVMTPNVRPSVVVSSPHLEGENEISSELQQIVSPSVRLSREEGESCKATPVHTRVARTMMDATPVSCSDVPASHISNGSFSSSLTICNIRDSIKRTANNSKKRLMSTQTNNSVKAKPIPSLNCRQGDSVDNCCEPVWPTTKYSCSETVVNDSEKANCDVMLKNEEDARVTAFDQSVSTTINLPEGDTMNDDRSDTVQHCLGTIADAVKNSAEFLHNADRNFSQALTCEKDFPLNRVSLHRHVQCVDERTMWYAGCSRPYSDTVNYSVSTIPRASVYLRHSAHPVLQSTKSNPGTKCSVAKGVMQQGAAMECNSEALEPMEVCSTQVDEEGNVSPAKSDDNAVMYATEVDQCLKTVYQKVTDCTSVSPSVDVPLIEQQLHSSDLQLRSDVSNRPSSTSPTSSSSSSSTTPTLLPSQLSCNLSPGGPLDVSAASSNRSSQPAEGGGGERVTLSVTTQDRLNGTVQHFV